MFIAAMSDEWCYFSNEGWCRALQFWHWMNIITRGSLLVLSAMFIIESIIVFERGRRYNIARRQSRRFAKTTEEAFRRQDTNAALDIAIACRESHIAALLAEGLAAYRSASEEFDSLAVLNFSQRALRRAQRQIHEQLQANLRTLGTISATAPFVGLMGTVFGLLNAFRGYVGDKYTIMRIIADECGESLIPTAMGLLVAVVAVCFYNYFVARLEVFDTEMSNASLELVDWIVTQNVKPVAGRERPGPILTSLVWPYDLQRLLLLAVGFCELYLVYIFGVAALQ